MRIEQFIVLLAFALHYQTADGQSSIMGNAAPGLRSDTNTVQVAFYQLPSLSALPSAGLKETSSRQPILVVPSMPAAYSYEKLGAFCKWEVQLEKAARMPVKFRLGEVQYVERMEGKLPDY